MSAQNIRRVVIVGGGTAGWITAALLGRTLGGSVTVTLVESEEIGTVGVGEATIPSILLLNQALGIDQADFMLNTQATIKLGIEFQGWTQPDQRYMHAFGQLGRELPFCGFEQLWLRARQAGDQSELWDYSLNYQAARRGKFVPLDAIPKTDMAGLSYAFHFDASLYARYLRAVSESAGVTRIEGLVQQVVTDSQTGWITEVRLKDGTTVPADLFIDCTGFRGRLIQDTLGVPLEDWTHWLPCDRALAVQSEATFPIRPYTEATAHEAGWRWRIPLATRTGNGVVFSSKHMSEEAALAVLLSNLDGAAKTEPKLLQFRAGQRAASWSKNCVAIGLSAGFLEPLESTGIQLIQSAVIRLLRLFPRDGIRASVVHEFNRQTHEETAHIRDFLTLHYWANARKEKFWRERRETPLPASLVQRIELFRETGRVETQSDALFSNVAWYQVMLGQGIFPQDYHPLADSMSDAQLAEYCQSVRSIIDQVTQQMPSHERYLSALQRSKTAK